MTLAETLQGKVSSWRTAPGAGGGRHSWREALPDHGWAVAVVADRADTVGCLVWELTLTRTAEPPAGLTLRGWADGVAGRVSGLLEGLKVHEVDDGLNVAVLRSDEPTHKTDGLAYYEVRLTGLTDAVVRRYKVAKEAGARREQVAFAVTHEVLGNLVGDVAG